LAKSALLSKWTSREKCVIFKLPVRKKEKIFEKKILQGMLALT